MSQVVTGHLFSFSFVAVEILFLFYSEPDGSLQFASSQLKSIIKERERELSHNFCDLYSIYKTLTES